MQHVKKPVSKSSYYVISFFRVACLNISMHVSVCLDFRTCVKTYCFHVSLLYNNMGEDTFDLELCEMDLDRISLIKPKRTGDSLFGKILYMGKEFNVLIYNAVVIKHKRVKQADTTYSVLLLKMPRRVSKHWLLFDKHCVESVKANMGSWFTKALDENVIEEYYTSSVALNDDGSYIVKLKLQGDETLLSPGKFNIKIALKGLRFYKQRFIAEWNILSSKSVDADFLNSIESDEEVWEETEPEEIQPSQEELDAITADLSERIAKLEFDIKSAIDPLHKRLVSLAGLKNNLELGGNDLKALDQITEELEHLIA